MFQLLALLAALGGNAPAADPLGPEITSASAYPNPFNPLAQTVTLAFTLSQAADVTIRAYDWGGGFVGSVFDGPGNAGANLIPWDGRAEDGTRLANGVYLLRVEAGVGTGRDREVLRVAVWND
jgi:flagellar hook assembly protein FlgD